MGLKAISYSNDYYVPRSKQDSIRINRAMIGDSGRVPEVQK